MVCRPPAQGVRLTCPVLAADVGSSEAAEEGTALDGRVQKRGSHGSAGVARCSLWSSGQFYSPAASDIAYAVIFGYAEWYSLREFERRIEYH